MEEEDGGGFCSTKKQRLDIDFDKCLEDSKDEAPPEIVIVKAAGAGGYDDGESERSQGVATMEEVRKLSDQDLEEKIRRMSRLEKRCSKQLPDKGEKLKANLRFHEEEKARRKLRTGLKAGIECKNIEHTESSRPSGISAEVRGEARIGSQFAALLSQKLETDKGSHTRIYDAFEEEPQTLGHGDRRKRKQKARLTHKGRDKNGLKGRQNPSVASREIMVSHQIDLAEDNEKHRLKNACQGLQLDKSNTEKTVVLLDEEEANLGERTPTAMEAAMRDMTIYYPSRNDPECVEIQYKDLKCLDCGEYLTSTIMNFYIRFLQRPSSAAEDTPCNYHFFNTYFYKKLQEAVSFKNGDKEASFLKFRRWWRGVNLFEKAYIFLPVHEDLHWSLAIVCIPDKKDESGPIILHLDSLTYHCSGSIFENIKRFLRDEWNYLKEEIGPCHVAFTNQIWENLPRRIEEKIITVPRQKNDSDCGLFVLYFMELFIKDVPQRLRKQDLRMFGRHWFKAEQASDLRWNIKTALLKEFGKSMPPSNCDSTKKAGTP